MNRIDISVDYELFPSMSCRNRSKYAREAIKYQYKLKHITRQIQDRKISNDVNVSKFNYQQRSPPIFTLTVR